MTYKRPQLTKPTLPYECEVQKLATDISRVSPYIQSLVYKED